MSEMGLELQQNLEKSVIHVFCLLENTNQKFSIVLCVKNSSKRATFFNEI